MKQLLFVKNVPIDEKRINFIETILSRLIRRSRKSTSTIITPHLISKFVSEEIYGDILNIMMFKGKVNKALVCFDKRPKVSICIDVKILSGKEGFTKSYYVDTMRSVVDLDLETIDGSIVTVSIHPTIEEEEKHKLSKIWLSILWTPHISRASVQSHLIDSLDKVAEELLIEE